MKVPRLPVRDDTGDTDDAGRPDPKYFRLWEHVKDALSPADSWIGGLFATLFNAGYRQALEDVRAEHTGGALSFGHQRLAQMVEPDSSVSSLLIVIASLDNRPSWTNSP